MFLHLRVFRAACQHPGDDDARRDHVDPDAVPGLLPGGVARELQEGRLGRAVQADPGAHQDPSGCKEKESKMLLSEIKMCCISGNHAWVRTDKADQGLVN